MKKAFSAFLMAAIMFLTGCEMKAALLKSDFALENEGEVFLYLQPLPHQAARLKFSIEGLSAVRNDGTEYPLEVRLQDLSLSTAKRQRLLGSGHLPPGSYSGLSMKVKKATLAGEEGESDLLLPEKPAQLNFPFSISAKRGLILSMTFSYEESVGSGFRFQPSFSFLIPEKPLFNLTGYVTNSDSHSVTVFDKKSGLVARVIETGRGPRGMALDQKAKRAYVALSGDDAIDVIDVVAEDVIKRMLLNTGDKPQGLALTPDGRTLLSVNTGSNSVSFIDPFTLIETNRLSVGISPNSVLLDRTGRRAFVFNTVSNTISVIDIPNKAVSATIGTEAGPLWGQFNRKGDRLYVYFERSPYLVMLDSLSLTLVKRIFIGATLSSLKVDVNTDFLYVGRKHSDTIDIYDPFSFIAGDFIRSGSGTDYTTIDGEGNNLCMVLPDKGTLLIVNLISKNVVSEMDVGDAPYWTSIMGER